MAVGFFQRITEKRQKRQVEFRDIVLQMARDLPEIASDLEVLDIIRDAGRTVSDLEAAVQIAKLRMRAVADLETAAALERDELPPATEYENDCRETFQAGEEARKIAHQQELACLRDASNSASTIRHRAIHLRDAARATLVRTADSAIGTEIHGLRQQIDQLRQASNSDWPPRPKIATKSGEVRQASDEAQYEAEVRDHAARRATREQEITAATARIAELEAQLLDPTRFSL